MTEKPRICEAKCQPPYFGMVAAGLKNWEFRILDGRWREIGVGDILRLREWMPKPKGPGCQFDAHYTGKSVDRLVTARYEFTVAQLASWWGHGVFPVGVVLLELENDVQMALRASDPFKRLTKLNTRLMLLSCAKGEVVDTARRVEASLEGIQTPIDGLVELRAALERLDNE